MLPRHVALVAAGKNIPLDELSEVAAAIQKQVVRDFLPLWRIEADVTSFAQLEDVPLDYWPIIVKDGIGDKSAGGYHEDKHGQPFALVEYSGHWPLAASHEILEMLADPYGQTLIAAQSPRADQGRVQFLLEICDPCEASSYSVNGITVSDFYTPRYFDPVPSRGVRYSFCESIKRPFQVLKDGYLSWYDPASRQWWRRHWFGAAPADQALRIGELKGGNIRATLDRLTEKERGKALKRAGGAAAARRRGGRPFKNRAQDLRAFIRGLADQ